MRKIISTDENILEKNEFKQKLLDMKKDIVKYESENDRLNKQIENLNKWMLERQKVTYFTSNLCWIRPLKHGRSTTQSISSAMVSSLGSE